LMASAGHSGSGSEALRATPRIWEHIPATQSWDHLSAVNVAQAPRSLNLAGAHNNLAHAINNNWTSSSHAMPVQAPLAGMKAINSHRLPVRMPSMPVIR